MLTKTAAENMELLLTLVSKEKKKEAMLGLIASVK